MAERVIAPTGRGFLLLDAHPGGCVQTVNDLRDQVPPLTTPSTTRPVALVIGSSAGYGLAMTIAGLARFGIHGVGIAFERPPGRRTATAGWYRTIAADAVATQFGCNFTFVNGDAFADATKAKVLDLIAERFGALDHLIYSVAAPRRTDPDTGATYQSVIKPLTTAHTTRTLEFDRDGAPTLQEITVEPADVEEADGTVRVMGGDDWSRWITALSDRRLLREGFRTVALSRRGDPGLHRHTGHRPVRQPVACRAG